MLFIQSLEGEASTLVTTRLLFLPGAVIPATPEQVSQPGITIGQTLTILPACIQKTFMQSSAGLYQLATAKVKLSTQILSCTS